MSYGIFHTSKCDEDLALQHYEIGANVQYRVKRKTRDLRKLRNSLRNMHFCLRNRAFFSSSLLRLTYLLSSLLRISCDIFSSLIRRTTDGYYALCSGRWNHLFALQTQLEYFFLNKSKQTKLLCFISAALIRIKSWISK